MSAPVKDKTEVRQGVTGQNVRYVLIASLGLAVLALLGVAFYAA